MRALRAPGGAPQPARPAVLSTRPARHERAPDGKAMISPPSRPILRVLATWCNLRDNLRAIRARSVIWMMPLRAMQLPLALPVPGSPPGHAGTRLGAACEGTMTVGRALQV